MSATDRIRRRDRLHLVHHVLLRLRERGYFSSRQVWQAAYWGTNPVHRYTHTRVRGLLSRYVDAGILSRDDNIAACPLYRHLKSPANQVDQLMLLEFESHSRRKWSPAYEIDLKLIDHDLDRLIPKDVSPVRFISNGSVLPKSCVTHASIHRLVPQPKPSLMSIYR